MTPETVLGCVLCWLEEAEDEPAFCPLCGAEMRLVDRQRWETTKALHLEVKRCLVMARG